jgi:signal transduction histidine kinase
VLDLTDRTQRAETRDLAEAFTKRATASAAALPLHGTGLAVRVLAVTVSFVLLAMGLFYVTRLTAYRETWLHSKVAGARAGVEAFNADGPIPPSGDLAMRMLNADSLKSISLATPTGRRDLVLPGPQPVPDQTTTPDDASYLEQIEATFHTLLSPPGTIVRIATPPTEPIFDVTLDETPLIDALWRVSRNFVTISLTIAAVVTCVLWAALWRMVLQPVRRLTSNIIAFGESPHDSTRVIEQSGRRDEVGRAERALAAMELSLAHELAQGKRLAELGMAVARINHDLRNMLAAAQLISDRLATIPDPLAQRLAPRLVATLDRAIQFCQSTLTFGAGRELPPSRRRFDLSELIRQVVEAAEAEAEIAIDYAIDIPPRFQVYADPDHILRVLENLSRNAAQALAVKGAQGGRPKAIRFAAIRTEGLALIEISDTGPGFPADQNDRIFEPFHKSTSEFGAGLGLAIAADLVTRNGGAIALAPSKADDFYCGARFLIKLPTPEGAARKETRLLPEA